MTALQVGKKYINRNGEEVTIKKETEHGDYLDERGRMYYANGEHCMIADFDLVDSADLHFSNVAVVNNTMTAKKI